MNEETRALEYVREHLNFWPKGVGEVTVDGDGEILFEDISDAFYPPEDEVQDFVCAHFFTKDEVFPWKDNEGECPYEEGTLIDVVYRDGDVNLGVEALVHFSRTGTKSECNACDWDLDGAAGDIMRHRLHVPFEPVAEEIEDERSDPSQESPKTLTGGSSDYYKVMVKSPTTADEPYQAECNDIIEALDMTFAEGNALKAIWRTAAARQGKGKPGTTAKYDAEKVVFFGERMLIQAQEEEK